MENFASEVKKNRHTKTNIQFFSELKTVGFERTANKEDEESVILGDLTAGSKSELDVIHGYDFDSSVESEHKAPEKFMSRGVVILLSTVKKKLFKMLRSYVLFSGHDFGSDFRDLHFPGCRNSST